MVAEGLASRAEVVLDPRLAEVWQLVWARHPDPGDEELGMVPEEMLAGLLRLAYVQGYTDAAAEPDAGMLYRELGVRDPTVTGRKAGRPRTVRRRRDSSDR